MSPALPGKFTFGGGTYNKDNAIVLEPGSGFAVVQSNFSGYAEFYVEATILYDPQEATVTSGRPVVGNNGLVRGI